MATFKTFEEIEVWQKSRNFTKEVYNISKQNTFYKDLGLREQIRRASVSIMSNISEGFERNGKKEFLQFLSIAKGSAGEVRSHLYVAYDQEYLIKEKFDELIIVVTEISRMLNGLMNYLKNSTYKGVKYK
jgi:four helix bundle protein